MSEKHIYSSISMLLLKSFYHNIARTVPINFLHHYNGIALRNINQFVTTTKLTLLVHAQSNTLFYLYSLLAAADVDVVIVVVDVVVVVVSMRRSLLSSGQRATCI